MGAADVSSLCGILYIGALLVAVTTLTVGSVSFVRVSPVFFRNACRFPAHPFDITQGGPRMKYMLLIYAKEDVLNDAEREACYEKSTELCQQLASKGQFISASPLQSVITATSVQVREGKRLVTDGPFAETREQLGGYFMIDANNLDEALDIASRIPAATWGTVEVRPIVELPNLPEEKNDAAVEIGSGKSTQR
jgi:hypothetical protein